MTECVTLSLPVVCVCVCVCVAPKLVQTTFNEGLMGTRVYHLPPPTPSVQPNPSATSSSSLQTHTILHSRTPYQLNLVRKTRHIRPTVGAALFLNPPSAHHPEEKIYNTITVSALLVTASILILKDG